MWIVGIIWITNLPYVKDIGTSFGSIHFDQFGLICSWRDANSKSSIIWGKMDLYKEKLHICCITKQPSIKVNEIRFIIRGRADFRSLSINSDVKWLIGRYCYWELSPCEASQTPKFDKIVKWISCLELFFCSYKLYTSQMVFEVERIIFILIFEDKVVKLVFIACKAGLVSNKAY